MKEEPSSPMVIKEEGVDAALAPGTASPRTPVNSSAENAAGLQVLGTPRKASQAGQRRTSW